ncbi:MAG: sensor histidine kinase [Bacteroidetes bacterium]|nr:sensor histidine kinase [Bacteroidota bacterium]
MDIYKRKSNWKKYLAAVGVVLILISQFYAQYLSQRLAEEEKQKADLWAKAYAELNNPVNEECSSCQDLTIPFDIIKNNQTIPVILVDPSGVILDSRNFNTTNPKNIENELERLKRQGNRPIESYGNKLYYKESVTLRQLRFFPLMQLGLIAAFIFFGYIGFSSARREEQNRVWVGMAKETAHQLGTPISGLVAWIDLLKTKDFNDAEVADIIAELEKDVNRLELVAERFSKIGSAPQLLPVNIYEQLDACRHYMQRRAPRKVSFEFPSVNEFKPIYVGLNAHLFDWVIENLLRNALDAMDGKGIISAHISLDTNQVHIDISDNGKGIPPSKHKTVFQPGFTTKNRGWGLGLSLAKRIIEDYHEGKIFVKYGEENKGTTFSIILPLYAEKNITA